MDKAKTLLRVPELVKVIEPLVSVRVTTDDIFRLIGTGDISPLGFMQRIPVFSVEQIGDIANQFKVRIPLRCIKCGEAAWVEVDGEYYCKACYEVLRK
jgi:hypothetical protein